MRLLVTRPEPDAGETAARLTALGHDVIVQPMLDVVFNPPPADLRPRALVFTSRNAVRALARWPDAAEWHGLPVFAVGAETAALAGEAGFTDVHAGRGDAKALVELVAGRFDRAAGSILYPAPRDQAADLAARLTADGFEVVRIEAYRTEPARRLGEAVAQALRNGGLDGALFFSRRTAAAFVAVVASAGLTEAARRLKLFALSAAAAEPLRPLGADIRVAARPETESLLALLTTPG